MYSKAKYEDYCLWRQYINSCVSCSLLCGLHSFMQVVNTAGHHRICHVWLTSDNSHQFVGICVNVIELLECIMCSSGCTNATPLLELN